MACTVCGRPDVAEINAALSAREGLGAIVKRFPGLAKTTLRRHRDGCASRSTSKPPEKPGKQRAGTVPRESGRERAATRESRVWVIMGLMASQRWESSDAERFAEEWGVHPTTVQSYAGEAGRRLVAMEDQPEVARWIQVSMAELVDVAMTAARTGDPKAIASAAQVFRVWFEKGRAAPADKSGEPPMFKIDLSLPVRPPPEGDNGGEKGDG